MLKSYGVASIIIIKASRNIYYQTFRYYIDIILSKIILKIWFMLNFLRYELD